MCAIELSMEKRMSKFFRFGLWKTVFGIPFMCLSLFIGIEKREGIFASLKAGPDRENLVVLKLCSLRRRYMRKQLSAKNF